jgi:hypothetical protein
VAGADEPVDISLGAVDLGAVLQQLAGLVGQQPVEDSAGVGHQLSDDRGGDQRSGVEVAGTLVDTQQGSDRRRHLAEGFQPCRFGVFEDEAGRDVGADLVEVATVFVSWWAMRPILVYMAWAISAGCWQARVAMLSRYEHRSIGRETIGEQRVSNASGG